MRMAAHECSSSRKVERAVMRASILQPDRCKTFDGMDVDHFQNVVASIDEGMRRFGRHDHDIPRRTTKVSA
jgi:hypothetical protein